MICYIQIVHYVLDPCWQFLIWWDFAYYSCVCVRLSWRSFVGSRVVFFNLHFFVCLNLLCCLGVCFCIRTCLATRVKCSANTTAKPCVSISSSTMIFQLSVTGGEALFEESVSKPQTQDRLRFSRCQLPWEGMHHGREILLQDVMRVPGQTFISRYYALRRPMSLTRWFVAVMLLLLELIPLSQEVLIIVGISHTYSNVQWSSQAASESQREAWSRQAFARARDALRGCFIVWCSVQ